MTRITYRWRHVASCALLCGISLATGGAQASTPNPPALFSSSPENGSALMPERAIPGKGNAVEINRGRLRSGRLFVDLPGGVSLEAVRDLRLELGHDRYAWVGRASGDARSRVVIAVSGESMAGTFAYRGKLYKLEPRRNGSHVISEVENVDPAPELDPIPAADLSGANATPGRDAAPAATADGGQTIDVLVAYTPKLLNIYGQSGADALVIQAVAEANQAYANSGITARLNLVASVLTNYTESGSMTTDLSRLQLNGDGYMDELHALRDSYGADLVSLIEDEPQYCGLAYLMTNLSTSFAASAFSVVHRTCATGYLSFAHELGHNQGVSHDPANASTAIYPYAYGHQEPFGAFRTVMAYNCPGGCPRVDHFSNPNVLFNGQPTGVPELSDNSRAINATAATVASFRQRTTQSAPSAPTGLSAIAAGHSAVSLSWQDTSGEESGFRLERSGNGVDFAEIASLPANTGSYLDDSLSAETLYYYRVRAWNGSGNSGFSSTATVMTEAPPAFIDQTATADIAIAGRLDGSFENTWADDGVYQAVGERQSGGKKASRYSYLEHTWTFTVQPGNAIQLFADVDTAADSDAFTFAYSTDNSSFVDMFTVDAGNSGMQQFMLPPSLSGPLYITVRDNQRSAGTTTYYSLRVDQLLVRTEFQAGDPPAAPDNLAVAAAGATAVDVSWRDMSDNEHGFTVERRIDSSAVWRQVGTAGAGATSFHDTGLEAATLYHYRVRAFNLAGESAASNTSSTLTDEQVAASSIDLSATTYKVKGARKADLTWSGSQSALVDIYRDAALLAGSVANTGAYTDDIERRGGGSYLYEVCEAGSANCSNSVELTF